MARPWLWLILILGAILLVLFIQSFQPGEILFANDVTLGQMKAPPNRLPGAFAGTWHSGAWVGIEGVAVAPTVTALLTLLLSPEIFLKIYPPLSMLFLGFCAWVFFRQLQFNRWVCLLGGLAAGLNMHYFSLACWGLGAWNVATGMTFLALAALHARSIPQWWARGILAGLAVGMNLMEGFDVGAIQCVFVGFYIVWNGFQREGSFSARLARSLLTEAVVVACAALMAAHAISSLVSTQVEGISGTGQDVQTKEEHWDFATRWSLPKTETLRLFTPGIFGYRMASRINVPDRSSAYWGTVGRDTRLAAIMGNDPAARDKAFESLSLSPEVRAQFESSDPQTRNEALYTFLAKYNSSGRYSGSGEYAGLLVSVLAVFGMVHSWRRARSPYSAAERKAAWFWTAAAVISVLAAWGRHGFFYHWLYRLPYFSTIRNPIKFLHPFHLAWLILAAYGMEALARKYLQPAATNGVVEEKRFEKNWMFGTVAVGALAIVGAVLFYNNRPALIEYFSHEGFRSDRIGGMANFALGETVWSIFFLIVSAGVVLAVMKRIWTGAAARTAWLVMGIVIVVDLARADVPWIHYFNYEKEYTDNEVIDFLRDKPYAHRVIGRIVPKGVGSSINTPLGKTYDYWQQNEFPYNGIETLDFPQWPRMPELDAAYLKNFYLKPGPLNKTDLWPAERLWELTDTRYILYSTELGRAVNRQADAQHQLQVRTLLSVHNKSDVTFLEDAGELTADPDPRGQYALMDFPNALPRAKLYADWRRQTNDEETLQTLLAPDFDPHRTVLVAANTSAQIGPPNPAADPGTVDIVKYTSKDVELRAHAAAAAILLLNDRVAPDWRATVDGKLVPILRCNFLMRGVALTPGDHTVEFRFRPPLTTLWISLCAWGLGLMTAAYVIGSRPRAGTPVPETVAPVNPIAAAIPTTPPSPVKPKENGAPARLKAEAGPRRRPDVKQTKRR
jgi:hypothetical protein